MVDIQQLLQEAVLYHDYRRREAVDLSGNENHGVISGIPFDRDGGNFNGGYIEVANSTELRITEGTIVVLTDIKKQEDYDVYLTKRSIASTDYEVYISSTAIAMRGNNNTAYNTDSPIGKEYIGIDFKNNAIPVLYLDGVASTHAFDKAIPFVDHGNDITIGEEYSHTLPPETHIKAVLLFPRQLDATEHTALYGYLSTLRFPQKASAKFTKSDGSGDMSGWKTDWAANVSDSAVSSGFLENTPFIVDSGSWKIGSDMIDGEGVKVIECVTAGLLYIPTSAMGQTPTEAAYGEWGFYLWKDLDGNQPYINFAVDDVAGTYAPHGYQYVTASSETPYLRASDAGSSTIITNGVVGSLPIQNWNKFNITRVVNDWELFIDDVSIGTGTNSSYTTGKYFVLDFDVGDKIALSDIGGGHSIIKKLT